LYFLPGPIEDDISPREVIESVNEEPSEVLDIETRALETPEQLLGEFLLKDVGGGTQFTKNTFLGKKESFKKMPKVIILIDGFHS
jgi:hypothetical protein